MTSRENHFFHSLLAVLAFCAVVLPGRASAAKLYVVYASIGGTQAVGWVAREAGLFAKHGLDVELLFTGGGRGPSTLFLAVTLRS